MHTSALREVSGCMCTGLTCFVVILPVVAVEGVVVLKEVIGCDVYCTMMLVLVMHSTGMVLSFVRMRCGTRYGTGIVVLCTVSAWY